jgi:autotransporter-associated beta strand protein
MITNYTSNPNATGTISLNGDVTYEPSLVNTESSAIYSTHNATDQLRIIMSGTRTFNIGNGLADADLIIRPRISSTGGGGLIKTGVGTLQLEGSNTYTGASAVNAGVLRINGTINNSAVTVNDTGTLQGHGSTGAVTVESGGTLSPGASIGTLTSGALTMNGTSTFKVEINTATGQADKMVVNNGATATELGTGTATFDLTNLGPIAEGTFTLIDATGAGGLNGYFAGLAPTENLASFTVGDAVYTLNYAGGTGNDLVLTTSAVPEPASLSLLALGAAGLLKRRRRA